MEHDIAGLLDVLIEMKCPARSAKEASRDSRLRSSEAFMGLSVPKPTQRIGQRGRPWRQTRWKTLSVW